MNGYVDASLLHTTPCPTPSRLTIQQAAIFKGKDACAFPILDIEEAIHEEHNKTRGTFVKSAMNPDIYEVAAAPRLSRTPARAPSKDPAPGQHTVEVLQEFNYSTEKVKDLINAGAVVDTSSTTSKL